MILNHIINIMEALIQISSTNFSKNLQWSINHLNQEVDWGRCYITSIKNPVWCLIDFYSNKQPGKDSMDLHDRLWSPEWRKFCDRPPCHLRACFVPGHNNHDVDNGNVFDADVSPIIFPLYNLETRIIRARLTIASHKTILLLQPGDDIMMMNIVMIIYTIRW